MTYQQGPTFRGEQQTNPLGSFQAGRSGSQVSGSPAQNSPVRSLSGAYGGVPQQSTVGGNDQMAYLASVVEQSKKYGQDIERSVEELAHLLHKKTVECEGLRAIASENYNGLRESVRNEYEARLRSETRQHQELRSMQNKLDTLQAERNQLLAEVASLREVVQKMEDMPPAAPYSPNDNSLFNRIMRGTSDRSGDDGNPKGLLSSVHSWNLATKGNIPEGSQRDLINYVNNMDREHAKALHAAGVFDFLKVAMHRLCTPLPNGTYSDLPSVIGKLLKERRESYGPESLANEAAKPIPTIHRDAHQEAVDIFLKDNPGQHLQLQQQLDLYKGREHELYAKIRRDHNLKVGFEEAVAPKAELSAAKQIEGKIPLDASGGEQSLEINARIVLMYRMYNPSKLNGKELNEMLEKYPPEVLLSALIDKYGPEPTAAERRELIRQMCAE